MSRSQTGFGISNDFNRKFARTRPGSVESIHSKKCVVKLFPKSHYRGNQETIDAKGKFNPQPRMNVHSLKLEGDCCWKIKTPAKKWVQAWNYLSMQIINDKFHTITNLATPTVAKIMSDKNVGGWSQ